MAEAAVDEHKVRPELFPSQGVFVTAFDHFGDHGIVVDSFDGFDFESSVAAFKGFAVDEFNERPDRLGTGDIRHVNPLDNPDGLGCFQDISQLHEGFRGIAGKDFRLDVFLGMASLIEPFNQSNAVAIHRGFLVLQGL